MTSTTWLPTVPARRLGDRLVGAGQPVYVVAEIGVNHNGDLANALDLVDRAAEAGCDAVSFQKRSPAPRTAAGDHDVELGRADFAAIDLHAREIGIAWFASPWDLGSVECLEAFDPVCHRLAAACLTDDALLGALRGTHRPVVVVTGGSTTAQIRHAVEAIGPENVVLCHAAGTYPATARQLNLRMVSTLQAEFPDVPIGYSGQETGLQTTLAAVAMGAVLVERHVTLDRTMGGADHAAAVEPGVLCRLVRDIRVVSEAMGDGVHRADGAAAPADLRHGADRELEPA